jgi:hypothetical protein
MISLPNESDLLDHVRTALETAGEKDASLSEKEWFVCIASNLAKRLKSIGMDCCAKGNHEPCVGGEYLWDFTAFIYDTEMRKSERFIAQLAVVGEVEWDEHDVDHDFEKLLCADALVCFMTFQMPTLEEATKKLDWLQKACERRQDWLGQRGLSRPPAFLLSCWTWKPEHRFVHRDVLPKSPR